MESITNVVPTYKSQLSLCSRNEMISACKLFSLPLISFPGKSPKLFPLKAFPSQTGEVQESERLFKKLPPSKWGDHFLSAHVDASEMDTLEREIEAVKPVVSGMIMSSQCLESTKKKILMIYLLVSLGLMYLFEDEIEECLKEGFGKIEDMLAGENDLYTVSTIFWVFRTYGYNISSDVFERFKGGNGNFKECLIEDAKGMVSFFTTIKLESLAETGAISCHISTRIRNALCMPQHFNAEMVFTREYISFYEQEEYHNKMLLKFAKLNFKFLQLNWIQELKTFTKWWKQYDFASKLPPYFRDRMHDTVWTMIDDTCDRYGSVLEVADLVHCVERWAPDCADSLPEYMKTVFKFAWNVFKECESEGISEEGLSFNVQGLLEEFKIYLRANLCFAEWAHTDVVPTFDEYLEIGGVEVSMQVSIAGSLLGLGKTAREEEGYKWLKSRPKYVEAQAKRGRLMNDMPGFEDDKSRGYNANAINYYMKQYGVTEEEAFSEIQNMVRALDKILNEEFLKESATVPRKILKLAANFGKMVVFSYRTGEEYTNPDGIFKEHITSLFVNLIRL
ncbi:BnaA10g08490D [Brassica napus]|uniref:BnaA10g08490D protein n=1 Tax=Brassica napus TaxID=3708 RepID=A0A078I088_BRANA|nr:BnaA10g08490D [Brassica napus]